MNNNRILDIRENAELTQSEMAEILQTTQSNYSRWESGKELIPLSKLNLLCNYFHTSMDYITRLERNNIKTKKVKLDKVLIGKRLKLLRKELNLTQKDIANILHTTQSTISAYESGETLIIIAFAYQICKTYNISLDWLCCRSNVMYLSSHKVLKEVNN